MESLGNDEWRSRFVVDELGRYEYTVEAGSIVSAPGVTSSRRSPVPDRT
jgi:hypothetical protein